MSRTRGIMRNSFVCLLTVIAVNVTASHAIARDLSFEERVKAQEAIERVYYRHQLGATRPFELAVPARVIREKVLRSLRLSAAVDRYWSTPITAAALQRELRRMTSLSRMTERLVELEAALDDDSVLIQECLVRPVLAERLARSFFSRDGRIHAAARNAAVVLRDAVSSGTADPRDPRRRLVRYDRRSSEPVSQSQVQLRFVGDEEFRRIVGRLRSAHGGPTPLIEDDDAFVFETPLDGSASAIDVAAWRVAKRTWDSWWREVQDGLNPSSVRTVALDAPLPRTTISKKPDSGAAFCGADNTWDNRSLDSTPEGGSLRSTVWTGSEMIVWGGSLSSSVSVNSGGRYDPATDTWTPTATAGAPSARNGHTAVWTGSLMVVWGGSGGGISGGRYDPVTDTWTPTSMVGAPEARGGHTAVWTGTTMVVWGGSSDHVLNSGGQYDPVSDSWTNTSTLGAPVGRVSHTAVWASTRMIVWGGEGDLGELLGTGGQYDPASDSWLPTNLLGAPTARWVHTAIWTGSEMIVWGGATSGGQASGDGSRYDPVSDTWKPLSPTGAPTPRHDHMSVWNGSEMIVWGGYDPDREQYLNSGARYTPSTDTWHRTTTLGAPTNRLDASAVWSGNRMIVWGGSGPSGFQEDGGRYDPVTDTWTPAAPGGRPDARYGHRSVWTGNYMIVWGSDLESQTGGRYDPVIDSWSPTSMTGVPEGRHLFSMLWTGDRMIVWGGQHASNQTVNSGGRYDPETDAWSPTSTVGAPTARGSHTAVWTGTRMIVWGGETCCPSQIIGTGGQYDPIADSWTTTQTASAPSGRKAHVAEWTGSRMLIWGGRDSSFTRLQSGSRYDPIGNTWSPMSQSGAPVGREGALSVWSGDKMLVWGGLANSGTVVDGGRYDPLADQWSSMSNAGVPSARCLSAATWAGDRMLIWGGVANCASTGVLSTGAQYFPASDTWSPMSTTGAASPREWHTIVWTGSQAIIWGGRDDNQAVSSGGRWVAGDQRDDDGDGFTECGGDCNDGNPAIHPGAVDICDGFDNDCDGTVDNGITTPANIINFVAGPPKNQFNWAAVVGADRYDVVRGDLTTLRAGNGDFATSLLGCLENDSADTATSDDSSPAVDQGFYYLVRAQRVCKNGSYSQWTGAEQPGRDVRIAASPVACP